jgi:hypothetical protein
VFVTIDSPSEILVRGTSLTLTGRVWQRGPGGVPAEVLGVSLDWSSGNERLATVSPVMLSRAVVTGIGEGLVTIRAIPLDYEQATPGEVKLRVASTVEIDSVRPATVRYGEQLTVYGVGLGDVAQISLAGTPLIPDSASFMGNPTGAGQLRLWVPFPATSGAVAAVAKQGSSVSAPDTTVVLPYDIYDHRPGDLPTAIDLNGPLRFPPDTLFFSPALVLASGQTVDGYRFSRADTTSPVTFVVFTTLPVVYAFEPVLLPGPTVPPTFPLQSGPFGGDTLEWAIGLSAHYCRGIATPSIPSRPVARTAPVTVVRAFRQLPAKDVLLAVYGEPPGRYGIAVVGRYLTADPAIRPDRFEDNNTCVEADANLVDPDKQINPGAPFTDTLTIANAYEADWFRFTVRGPDTTLLTIRTAARPFGASDSSDIGLVLQQIKPLEEQSGQNLESRAKGSTESLTIEAEPGEYYLTILDEAGVPTRYSLCIGSGNTCPLIGASIQAAPGSAKVIGEAGHPKY